MIYLIVFGFVVIVSVVLRLVSALGLSVPIMYGILAPTLFYDWFHSHQQLAEGIGWALIALVAVSWIISLIRRIAGLVEHRREAEIEDMILLHRIRNGLPIDGKELSTIS